MVPIQNLTKHRDVNYVPAKHNRENKASKPSYITLVVTFHVFIRY